MWLPVVISRESRLRQILAWGNTISGFHCHIGLRGVTRVGFVLCSFADSTWHIHRRKNSCWLSAICFLRRVRILQPSALELPVISLLPVARPVHVTCHMVTRRSTWCYLDESLCIRIFNGNGSRPYVILFWTSRTSSYVLFLLAAFLPFLTLFALLQFHVAVAGSISRAFSS